MEQAPPTHPGSYDVLDLEDRDQTMVSKGPRHAEEFEMPEEENYPTLQMGGLAASELRDQASEVAVSPNFLDGPIDRTQVNLYQNQPTPMHSGEMWQTPSQDAWNSPFAGQQPGWSGYLPPPQPLPPDPMGWASAPPLGPNMAQPTYSGPVDIARSAGGDGLEKQGSGLVWWLVLMVVVAGTAIGAYLYLPVYLKKNTPKPEERKVFVVMEVETSPKGATIWVDGRKQQEPTPASISVRIGRTVQIQLRKEGYQTIDFQWQATSYDRRKFFLQANEQAQPQPRQPEPPGPIPPITVATQTQAQNPDKTQTKPRTVRKRPLVRKSRSGGPSVYLSLRTVPSGAKVRIGNQVWPGQTPLRIPLPEGQKVNVTVQKYGHQDAFFVWPATQSETHTIKLYRHSWYNP